ncbi:transposase [Streptomyces anulatus]|uniref:transposase n=1 Tax=Streptomyces anulatus TaxID=1892 RepID=UPI003635B786
MNRDLLRGAERTGCVWRQQPKDCPPWPTVYWYFTRWHDDAPSSASTTHCVCPRGRRTQP